GQGQNVVESELLAIRYHPNRKFIRPTKRNIDTYCQANLEEIDLIEHSDGVDLNLAERQILSLGSNFATTPRLTDRYQLAIAIRRFTVQMINDKMDTTRLAIANDFGKSMYNQYVACSPPETRMNISAKQIKALKDFSKHRNIVIKRANKGMQAVRNRQDIQAQQVITTIPEVNEQSEEFREPLLTEDEQQAIVTQRNRRRNKQIIFDIEHSNGVNLTENKNILLNLGLNFAFTPVGVDRQITREQSLQSKEMCEVLSKRIIVDYHPLLESFRREVRLAMMDNESVDVPAVAFRTVNKLSATLIRSKLSALGAKK
ncbi:hypothetical protein GJ496_001804, partial [Pomphorhynchus laevis]